MAAPVYVLGGYQTDFARNWTKENKHIVAMMREAVLGGLEATGIEPKDVEVGHVGNFAAELYAMQGHLGAFLRRRRPGASPACRPSRHEAACASGSIAILAASAEIEAGRYDLAMVVGVEQMKTVDPKTRRRLPRHRGLVRARGQGHRVSVSQALRPARRRVRQALRPQGRAPGAHLRGQLLATPSATRWRRRATGT